MALWITLWGGLLAAGAAAGTFPIWARVPLGAGWCYLVMLCAVKSAEASHARRPRS
jgi:hypothetical protein